jgi:hypothetical protein
MQRHPLGQSMRPTLAYSAGLLSTLAITTISMSSLAREEPNYRVVRELGGIELRLHEAAGAWRSG